MVFRRIFQRDPDVVSGQVDMLPTQYEIYPDLGAAVEKGINGTQMKTAAE
jgi:hypothetical protein